MFEDSKRKKRDQSTSSRFGTELRLLNQQNKNRFLEIIVIEYFFLTIIVF